MFLPSVFSPDQPSPLPNTTLTEHISNYDFDDWGWKLDNNQFVLIMSTMNAALAAVSGANGSLQLHNCFQYCQMLLQKIWNFCSAACGPCELESCQNKHAEELDDDECDE